MKFYPKNKDKSIKIFLFYWDKIPGAVIWNFQDASTERVTNYFQILFSNPSIFFTTWSGVSVSVSTVWSAYFKYSGCRSA